MLSDCCDLDLQDKQHKLTYLKKFISKSYHSKCTDSICSWGRNAYMTILGEKKACALVVKRYKRCYLEEKVDTTDKSGEKQVV